MSKESAHTPGPWRVEPDHDGDFLNVIGANGDVVAEWDLRRARAFSRDEENIIDADAAFIVRAVNCHTDLLAALEEALPGLQDLDGQNDSPYVPKHIRHRDERVLTMVRAAISKARGSSS